MKKATNRGGRREIGVRNIEQKKRKIDKMRGCDKCKKKYWQDEADET